ncbi:type VI secretion system, baseplate protein [Aliarcobacter faecis]|uniref:TssA family type VI secretion system protein n=1 Tax=Aliarcobacter faecis TaxID=1564138 RepID=UPI00047A20CD|nr:TssA family type VI secretion system protein [Aliarcobacter faecis]QKF73945.1 type VI secretion system, baseplate protein [Aliarcobacter faecis]
MVRESILEELSGTIVGKDCKYEDRYLQVELEIDKISSVTQEACNFRQIIENCEYLLSNETKDFKLASWWFYANFKMNDIKGLDYSIDCFINFIDKFHTSFYPKLNNSKLNIIDWLESNFSKDFENSLDLKNSIKNTNLYEKFLTLSSVFVKVTKEDREYFKDVKKFLQPSILEIVEKLEEKKENIVEVTEKNIKEEIPKQNSELQIVEITTEFEANKVLRNLRKSAYLLSKYYRKNDFSNFKSLRISRFLFLLDFEDIPASNGKRTAIYPPLITEIDLVESLIKQNKNAEALILAEEILEDCPFWIDGHFYTYQALKNTNFHRQAEEVKSNLIHFININKQILNLTFIEDTPFVSIKTKNWIEKEKKEKELQVVNQNIEVKEESNFFEKIDNFISDNNINEAIKFFEEKISLSKNFEEKFNWRLKFSEFAIGIGKKDIAIIFLEELIKEIEFFNLLDWNSKLASKVYVLVLSNFSYLEYEQEKIKNIYKNLCKIDINSAFELNLN